MRPRCASHSCLPISFYSASPCFVTYVCWHLVFDCGVIHIFHADWSPSLRVTRWAVVRFPYLRLERAPEVFLEERTLGDSTPMAAILFPSLQCFSPPFHHFTKSPYVSAPHPNTRIFLLFPWIDLFRTCLLPRLTFWSAVLKSCLECEACRLLPLGFFCPQSSTFASFLDNAWFKGLVGVIVFFPRRVFFPDFLTPPVSACEVSCSPVPSLDHSVFFHWFHKNRPRFPLDSTLLSAPSVFLLSVLLMPLLVFFPFLVSFHAGVMTVMPCFSDLKLPSSCWCSPPFWAVSFFFPPTIHPDDMSRFRENPRDSCFISFMPLLRRIIFFYALL